MIIRLTIFGIEVFCLAVGIPVTPDEDEDEDTEEEAPTARIGGGASHDFERDPAPLNPDDRYDWEFGFGNPKRVRKGGERASD